AWGTLAPWPGSPNTGPNGEPRRSLPRPPTPAGARSRADAPANRSRPPADRRTDSAFFRGRPGKGAPAPVRSPAALGKRTGTRALRWHRRAGPAGEVVRQTPGAVVVPVDGRNAFQRRAAGPPGWRCGRAGVAGSVLRSRRRTGPRFADGRAGTGAARCAESPGRDEGATAAGRFAPWVYTVPSGEPGGPPAVNRCLVASSKVMASG